MSYFLPPDLEGLLLARIKGTARRAELKRLLDAGQMDQVRTLVAKAKLSDDERKTLSGIHPLFMGGEYLPNQEGNEVEIARIEINSVSYDVTSVYARQQASGIRYRVVDEYEGQTLTGPPTRRSAKPLTLGELEKFFMGAWSLQEVLEGNFDEDVDQMLRFFRATSAFYPDLDRLLRQRVVERCAPSKDAGELDADK